MVSSSAHNTWIIVLSTGGKFFITAAFANVYIFTAELFPTVVRSIGVGSGSFWARVGGVIAPQIALLVSTKILIRNQQTVYTTYTKSMLIIVQPALHVSQYLSLSVRGCLGLAVHSSSSSSFNGTVLM